MLKEKDFWVCLFSLSRQGNTFTNLFMMVGVDALAKQ